MCDTFVKSLPKESYLRDSMYDVAAELKQGLADKLKGQTVNIAHDKGNSKGVETNAKLLSFFNEKTGEVETYLLDLSATGKSGQEICDGLVRALKEVGCPENFLLSGLATNYFLVHRYWYSVIPIICTCRWYW